MPEMKDLFQSADWKKEKHVPVIECPGQVKKGEPFQIRISVGKEIPHPNTTEHHISWIDVYFLPEGEKFPCQVARFELCAHGASTQGPNTSTMFTIPEAVCVFKTEKKGTIAAGAYCNIHGLWQGSKDIVVA